MEEIGSMFIIPDLPEFSAVSKSNLKSTDPSQSPHSVVPNNFAIDPRLHSRVFRSSSLNESRSSETFFCSSAVNDPGVFNAPNQEEDVNGVSPGSPKDGGFHPLLFKVTPEDESNAFVSESLNGTRTWLPIVADEFRPAIGSNFDSFDEAIAMYEKYAIEAGFSVRRGQSKSKNGMVIRQYIRCNKAGKPQGHKRSFDSMSEMPMKVRASKLTVCECKAHLCVKFSNETSKWFLASWEEIHNHPLVHLYNRDLTKIARRLTYSDKKFIHNMSVNSVGPSVAHRCMVSLKGGHHNVHGTPDDYKNYMTKIRMFIGQRDSQLVLERLKFRSDNIPGFFYDFSVENGRLRNLFWADDISKTSYQAFGDVLAYDATYHTNKYNMIFVPFTGVDHNKNCVTFGAGLLFNETAESYKWLLRTFLQAHGGKQPRLVLTDQDPAMKCAISQVFTDSRHRLCMWHIMRKLPSKIDGDLYQNSNIRARLHRLVWSVFIKPETFETRWQQLLEDFALEEHHWLREMYNIRDEWVPAYFRDEPMCCLMKTTSRCESSNASFKVGTNSAHTLLQFMMSFETRMDNQRYRQRRAHFKTCHAIFPDFSGLLIEKHAFQIYSHAIYLEVTKEILKGKLNCVITHTEVVNGRIMYSISHLDRHNSLTNVFKVSFNSVDHSATCSCMGFTRIGYICRHIFCVYRANEVHQIPEQYIIDRWRKNVLPTHVYSVESRYGVDNSPQNSLRSEIMQLVTDCVDLLWSDADGLESLASRLRVIKEEFFLKSFSGGPPAENDESVIEKLLGQPVDVEVVVSNPDGVRTKGCGKTRRIVGAAEKAIEKGQKTVDKVSKPVEKVPRLCHTCNKYVIGHDTRNCKKIQEQEKRREVEEKKRKEGGNVKV